MLALSNLERLLESLALVCYNNQARIDPSKPQCTARPIILLISGYLLRWRLGYTMKPLNKTIKDFKDYLDGIATLAKPLNSEQKEDLNNILKVQLSLLVALKRDSELGRRSIKIIKK